MQSIARVPAHANTVPSHDNSVVSAQFDPLRPWLARPGVAVDVGGADPHGGVAPGLVHSQTSVPKPPFPSVDRIHVDSHATRLRRLKHSVLTAARLHTEQKGKWKVAMLTLTYRPGVDWEKGQCTGIVRCIRKYLAARNVEMRYVWVMEFTKAGRPHYHMLLWLPFGLTLPKPDKRGWWPHGMTKIEWARNAVGYIAKYASKGDSLDLPEKGAHMHGNGGIKGDALLEQRWWKLPSWARESVVPSDRCKRRKGGGLILPETGEVLVSPWLVIFEGGQVYLVRKKQDI